MANKWKKWFSLNIFLSLKNLHLSFWSILISHEDTQICELYILYLYYLSVMLDEQPDGFWRSPFHTVSLDYPLDL